ncbi:Hypothetical protein, partial CDS, partial [Neorhizobium galegae bv. officinalis]
TFEFGAVAKPLSTILDEGKAPALMDILSLDVEGAELEVLMGVDFDRHNFRFMVIECRNIDRMRSFLEAKGYSLLDKLTGHDYLFKFNMAETA